MAIHVQRRAFIGALGGAAAWSLAPRAQQPTMPVVGFVRDGSADTSARLAAAFRKGLNEIGYIEGQNVTVEYHWLEGQYNRLPQLMTDLVRRQVAVIATPGNVTTAAARAATATIPIVFGVGDNPVKLGLVASLFVSRRGQFATLTARDRIPATFPTSDFVAGGGLMSYGADILDMFHGVGVYTGKVLQGAKPADMPVEQTTKFEFAINLQTARALGIEVPSGLLAIADEVIE